MCISWPFPALKIEEAGVETYYNQMPPLSEYVAYRFTRSVSLPIFFSPAQPDARGDDAGSGRAERFPRQTGPHALKWAGGLLQRPNREAAVQNDFPIAR